MVKASLTKIVVQTAWTVWMQASLPKSPHSSSLLLPGHLAIGDFCGLVEYRFRHARGCSSISIKRVEIKLELWEPSLCLHGVTDGLLARNSMESKQMYEVTTRAGNWPNVLKKERHVRPKKQISIWFMEGERRATSLVSWYYLASEKKGGVQASETDLNTKCLQRTCLASPSKAPIG